MAAKRIRVFPLFFIWCGSLLVLPSPGWADKPGTDRFPVPHDAAPGYIVGSVASWGQDMSVGGKYSRYFRVRPNGDIVVSADLSILTDSTFSIVITNKQGAWKWRNVLYITLTDPDDNGLRHHKDILVFQQPSYEGHVLENSPGGSAVGGLATIAVKRKHKHLGRRIQYRITDGRKDLFELIPGFGDAGVSLHITQPLDREQTSAYTLTVEAASGNMALAHTKISVFVDDENDHTPIFEKTVYSVTIKADTPAHTEVFRVTASDPDSGNITYVLTNERDIFEINRTTGAIVLKSRPHLQSSNYVLTVFAEDNDGKRSQTVIVRVNVVGNLNFDLDNHVVSPRHRRNVQYIRPIERDIEENMIGDLMDLPNEINERFSFKDPAPDMLFIHPITGVVRLREGKLLDYESQKEIDFTVIITRTDDASGRLQCDVSMSHIKAHHHMIIHLFWGQTSTTFYGPPPTYCHTLIPCPKIIWTSNIKPPPTFWSYPIGNISN